MVSTLSLHAIRLFYAAYFAAMGVILPYFPVYLEARGLDVAMIGVMTGLLAFTKVVAPPWIGAMSDRRAHRGMRRFIVAASAVGALAVLFFSGVDNLWLLAALIVVFGVLWSSILPLTDGLSVSVSEAALADYGRLRVWGSIGFVIASLAGGLWLVADISARFPWWVALLMLLMGVAALRFPDQSRIGEKDDEKVVAAGNGSRLKWLLLASFVMQVSHGAYYGFYSLYLGELGYSGWQIGSFWVIGVLAEIVLMWGWSQPLQRAAPATVLSVSLVLAALRWLGIGLVEAWYWLVLLQLLHAASFAAFHISAVTWVKRLAPDHAHAAAQGWYSASGFGLGSTVGIMGCGVLAEAYGYPAIFYTCSAIALLGTVFAGRLPRTQ